MVIKWKLAGNMQLPKEDEKIQSCRQDRVTYLRRVTMARVWIRVLKNEGVKKGTVLFQAMKDL